MYKNNNTSRKPPHYAWLVLIGCCFIQFWSCGVQQNAVGIYIPYVCSEFGYTTAQYTLAYTFGSLISVITMPIAGKVIPKYKPKYLITASLSITYIAYAGTALCTRLWHWYVCYAVRGLAGSFVYMIMSPIILRNWFAKKSGFAVSIAMSFSGFGGIVINPMGNWLINLLGWRTAAVIIAVVGAALTLPFSLHILHIRPADIGKTPYGADEPLQMTAISHTDLTDQKQSSIFKERAFYLSLLATLMISSPIVFVNVWPNMGIVLGYGAAAGALMSSCMLIGNVSGKLLLGVLSDRFSIRKTLYIGVATTILGTIIVILSLEILPGIYFGAVLFGASQSLTAVGVPLFLKDIYPDARYNQVLSYCSMLTTVIMAIGISAVSFLYDIFGTYTVYLFFCIFVYAMLLLVISRLYNWASRRIPMAQKVNM